MTNFTYRGRLVPSNSDPHTITIQGSYRNHGNPRGWVRLPESSLWQLELRVDDVGCPGIAFVNGENLRPIAAFRLQ
jgi:hypothetical protein